MMVFQREGKVRGKKGAPGQGRGWHRGLQLIGARSYGCVGQKSGKARQSKGEEGGYWECLHGG